MAVQRAVKGDRYHRLLPGRPGRVQSLAVTGERYSSLKNIPHRTLVVNGHDDIMVPTVNSFILQQKLPDARLMLFPDSGHGSHFQFAEEFAGAAARFLAAD